MGGGGGGNLKYTASHSGGVTTFKLLVATCFGDWDQLPSRYVGL